MEELRKLGAVLMLSEDLGRHLSEVRVEDRPIGQAAGNELGRDVFLFSSRANVEVMQDETARDALHGNPPHDEPLVCGRAGNDHAGIGLGEKALAKWPVERVKLLGTQLFVRPDALEIARAPAVHQKGQVFVFIGPENDAAGCFVHSIDPKWDARPPFFGRIASGRIRE